MVDLFIFLPYNQLIQNFLRVVKCKMKKALIILVCFSILASLFACTHEAEENPASDFEYEFSSSNESALITKYIGKSKNVVIPSKIEGRTVTALKSVSVNSENGDMQGAFQNTDVETVVIPETIKAIGSNAFKNCTALTTVTIKPDSELYSIDRGVFENCFSLKEINIEDAEKLKMIEARAFYNCEAIESMILPRALETIGTEAFANCLSLKSITLPPEVEMDIDFSRFYNLPSLEEIKFEEGWQTISGYMFFELTSDVNITIPSSVKSIGVNTIKNDGTMKITFLGDCPELLGGNAFDGDVTIYYDADTKGWDTTPLKDAHTCIPN